MQLSNNWFIENNLDFEYKKYTLLAYLKKIEQCFNSAKLYPHYNELIKHYNNSKSILDNFKINSKLFPKELTDIDKGQLIYQNLFLENESVTQVKDILNFSINQFSTRIKEGQDLQRFLQDNISFFPLGILSNNVNSGYFFITPTSRNKSYIYQYELSPLKRKYEIDQIKTKYFGEYSLSISNTYERKKRELLFENSLFNSSCTYVFESSIYIPLTESYLPIVKLLLLREISAINS